MVKNAVTQEESPTTAVANNALYSVGVNIRYGGPLYTFFAELFYERKGLNTPMEAINETFQPLNDNLTVVSSSAKWNIVNPNSINFGGDWRISRNVILNYGMRCLFDKHWKFTSVIPVATVSCMMR